MSLLPLVRSVLPDGGYIVTWNAYFDESGTHSQSNWLIVAGYMFDDQQFLALDSKWAAMLESHIDSEGKPLPYFHMADCAHNRKVFKKYTRPQCDLAARDAIKLILDHMGFGFAFAIDKRHANLLPNYSKWTDLYSFACWTALMSIRRWADMNDYHGDVVYFFEAGHESQNEADKLMNDILNKPELKPLYRSIGHGFYDKRKVRPLQCSDILAWHWYTQVNRMEQEGTIDAPERPFKCRKDFFALLEHQERVHLVIYDEKRIREISAGHATTMAYKAALKYGV